MPTPDGGCEPLNRRVAITGGVATASISDRASCKALSAGSHEYALAIPVREQRLIGAAVPA